MKKIITALACLIASISLSSELKVIVEGFPTNYHAYTYDGSWNLVDLGPATNGFYTVPAAGGGDYYFLDLTGCWEDEDILENGTQGSFQFGVVNFWSGPGAFERNGIRGESNVTGAGVAYGVGDYPTTITYDSVWDSLREIYCCRIRYDSLFPEKTVPTETTSTKGHGDRHK